MIEAINAPFSEWNPYLFILLAGALMTQIWRFAGVLLSQHLQEDSEFIRWVHCVATALVAGVIVKLIVFPTGVLNDYPLWMRLMSASVGLGVYMLTKPKIIWGILSAIGMFYLAAIGL